MGLSEIAAGIEVTDEQRDRGVATVDETGTDICDRLADHAEALPCTPAAAATVLRSYRSGTSVGDCAREAGVAPMTAAKALHRCGVEGVSPLAPEAHRVVGDWVAGELPRTTARELSRADEAEFALAAYVQSHDPHPGLVAATAGERAPDRTATVEKRDRLAGPLDRSRR